MSRNPTAVGSGHVAIGSRGAEATFHAVEVRDNAGRSPARIGTERALWRGTVKENQTMSFRYVVPIVYIAALAAPRIADAQPSMSEPMSVRHGLFGGGALWGGQISFEGSGCCPD